MAISTRTSRRVDLGSLSPDPILCYCGRRICAVLNSYFRPYVMSFLRVLAYAVSCVILSIEGSIVFPRTSCSSLAIPHVLGDGSDSTGCCHRRTLRHLCAGCQPWPWLHADGRLYRKKGDSSSALCDSPYSMSIVPDYEQYRRRLGSSLCD
jgi:hypothetical protein